MVTIEAPLVRETRVTRDHTTAVPAALRAKHGLLPGDLVVWEEHASGAFLVRFVQRGPRRG